MRLVAKLANNLYMLNNCLCSICQKIALGQELKIVFHYLCRNFTSQRLDSFLHNLWNFFSGLFYLVSPSFYDGQGLKIQFLKQCAFPVAPDLRPNSPHIREGQEIQKIEPFNIFGTSSAPFSAWPLPKDFPMSCSKTASARISGFLTSSKSVASRKKSFLYSALRSLSNSLTANKEWVSTV